MKKEGASKDQWNRSGETIESSVFANYGYLEEILVAYKINKITIDEAKIAIKSIIKPIFNRY